jgi:hypothetical protein
MSTTSKYIDKIQAQLNAKMKDVMTIAKRTTDKARTKGYKIVSPNPERDRDIYLEQNWHRI